MKLLVIAAAVLLHCSKADQITGASNQFAAELYQEVAKTPGNVLVCPVSVHIALALVHQGAQGNTAKELEQVLQLSGPKDQIRTSYKDMLSGLETDVLKIATKMFPANSFRPNRNFATVAERFFLSGIQPLDYSKAEEAANTINNFVQEKTNNKIRDIIKSDALSEQTRLVIVNAVHFKANWAKAFPPAYIDTFKISPEESVKTEFMGQTDHYAYKEDNELEAKVLRVDYEKGAYSMVFVLPNKEGGLQELEAKLATKTMDDILSGVKDSRVEVAIPKFKIEQEHQLKEVLSEMGIKRMFGSRADLRGVAEGENLAVDSVIQKTFIDVNEKGTEATAATGVVTPLSGGSEENRFIAKRPFHFYLIHTETPLVILFSGRLVKPKLKVKTTPNQPNPTNKEEGNLNVSNEEEDLDKLGNQQFTNTGINNGVYSGHPNTHTGSQPKPQKSPRPNGENVQPRPPQINPSPPPVYIDGGNVNGRWNYRTRYPGAQGGYLELSPGQWVYVHPGQGQQPSAPQYSGQSPEY